MRLIFFIFLLILNLSCKSKHEKNVIELNNKISQRNISLIKTIDCEIPSFLEDQSVYDSVDFEKMKFNYQLMEFNLDKIDKSNIQINKDIRSLIFLNDRENIIKAIDSFINKLEGEKNYFVTNSFHKAFIPAIAMTYCYYQNYLAELVNMKILFSNSAISLTDGYNRIQKNTFNNPIDEKRRRRNLYNELKELKLIIQRLFILDINKDEG